jgi:hypothetical protein
MVSFLRPVLGSRIVSARFGLLGRGFWGITTTFFLDLKNKQGIMLDISHLNTDFKLYFLRAKEKGSKDIIKKDEMKTENFMVKWSSGYEI